MCAGKSTQKTSPVVCTLNTFIFSHTFLGDERLSPRLLLGQKMAIRVIDLKNYKDLVLDLYLRSGPLRERFPNLRRIIFDGETVVFAGWIWTLSKAWGNTKRYLQTIEGPNVEIVLE
ncbi:hypothetical protein EK21DRAFT_115773 [Setomelanomma holmii]|uniref:Uncharacterized protein n=1 Tax=Setomelanomma holmii TaxID=210430 RepID=A0A9P4H3U8_9PLEO|nr:hypothetical protein EK21DRAFT_115773 [Setomelanomma holmii]